MNFSFFNFRDDHEVEYASVIWIGKSVEGGDVTGRLYSQNVEGNSRKTANLYGTYYHPSSYACSQGPPSIYNGYQTNGYIPHLQEDYRPIYFYVAQPYTIPYTFAKRPRPSPFQKPRKAKSHCRVKFSKKLNTAEFDQKVKQGEFSKSLNQAHFAQSQGQGKYSTRGIL